MTDSEFSLKEGFIKKEIVQLKLKAYLEAFLIGLMHSVVLYYSEGIFLPAVWLLLFFYCLIFILFWLKGNNVLDKNK